MMGMDMGMWKMPLIGRFFTNPNEVHKQTQFSKAGQSYSALRPEMAQARMNALSNQMSAYQGANDVLAAMNGGRSYGSGQILQQPIGPTMYSQGASKITPSTGAAQQGILGPGGIGGNMGPLAMFGGGGGMGMGGLGGPFGGF